LLYAPSGSNWNKDRDTEFAYEITNKNLLHLSKSVTPKLIIQNGSDASSSEERQGDEYQVSIPLCCRQNRYGAKVLALRYLRN
jgi:hypothetical protein